MPGMRTASRGVDAKTLLEDVRYDVEAPYLTPRAKADALDTHGVETSSLLLMDDEPIGGYDDLRRWLARNAH